MERPQPGRPPLSPVAAATRPSPFGRGRACLSGARRGGKAAAMAEPVTAALLVIGDEILSGRTKDKNIGYIAEYLTGIGIDLREVRVVPDEEGPIVDAVNALRRA